MALLLSDRDIKPSAVFRRYKARQLKKDRENNAQEKESGEISASSSVVLVDEDIF